MAFFIFYLLANYYGSNGGYIAAGILVPLFLICVITCVRLKQKRGYVFSQRPVFTTIEPQGNNMTVVNNQSGTLIFVQKCSEKGQNYSPSFVLLNLPSNLYEEIISVNLKKIYRLQLYSLSTILLIMTFYKLRLKHAASKLLKISERLSSCEWSKKRFVNF